MHRYLAGFCVFFVPPAFFLPALQAASPHKGTEILWDKYGVAHVYVDPRTEATTSDNTAPPAVSSHRHLPRLQFQSQSLL